MGAVNSKPIVDGAKPWAGMIGGSLGFALAHQIGSDSTFNDCVAGSPWAVIGGTLLGALLIGGGAFASWGVWRGKGEGPARSLIALVSLMACALYLLAILLPLIASMIIPRCFA